MSRDIEHRTITTVNNIPAHSSRSNRLNFVLVTRYCLTESRVRETNCHFDASRFALFVTLSFVIYVHFTYVKSLFHTKQIILDRMTDGARRHLRLIGDEVLPGGG